MLNDGAAHFTLTGARPSGSARAGTNCRREGRDPSPQFDTAGYLSHYPDVGAAHVDPLTHFLLWGMQEGRLPVNDGHFG